jgi:thiol-disulfide isomerase/thioredoxin
MEDIYGLIIILGLVLVIAQCANTERGLVESLVNGNSNDMHNMHNMHNNPPSNVNSGFKDLPERVSSGKPSNVFKYYPGEILNADANGPYGFKVPLSAQQEYTYLKDMGKSNDSAMTQSSVMSGYAKFNVTDSQLPGFNPTYKGGLLPSQMGKHVKSAMDVAHKLPRNEMNTNGNSNIVPSNMNNFANANSNVNSNRKPIVLNDSIINSNSIDLSNKNNNSKEINLHMIYTTWCGHSKRALPDFEKLMEEYDGQMMNGYKLNIKKHDSDDDKSVAKKYGVRGYPSYVMEKVENGQVGSSQPVNERSYDGLLNILKNSAV